ncbi:MAG: AAA family ATPase [Angustibacter sp.]
MSGAAPIALAITGGLETGLAARVAAAPDLAVVRRCADLADLLGLAASRQVRAAVLTADLRGLDADAIARLALAGCAPVVLVEDDQARTITRWHQLGVSAVVPVGAEPVSDHAVLDRVIEMVRAVLGGQGDPQRRSGTLSPRSLGDESSASLSTTATPGLGMSPPQSDSQRVAEAMPAGVRYRDNGAVAPGWADPAAPHVDLEVSDSDPMGGRPATGDSRSDTGASGSNRAQDGGSAVDRGRVVAVWGPAGAPGRSTVAIGLAAEVAAGGLEALLVDGDTYAASIAQTLGLLDEAPGLAAAARAADHGGLNLVELARRAPAVGPKLRVLTGISRAHRWPELRGPSLEAVLTVARGLADWVVADTSFCLEQDEELVYDTAAPRRNAATLVAVQSADTVVAVGSADPVGLQRLVRGLQDLVEVTATTPVVVVNRVRSSSVGSSPARRIRDALRRYTGVEDPLLIPDDGAALDAAMLAGRTLVEHAPTSPVRHAMLDLAIRLGAVSPSPERRRHRFVS